MPRLWPPRRPALPADDLLPAPPGTAPAAPAALAADAPPSPVTPAGTPGELTGDPPPRQDLPAAGRAALPGAPGPAPAAHAAAARPSSLAALRRPLRRLWHDHWLMTIAVALSLVPRALAALAFRPALFTPDSFGYLAQGIRPIPGEWHPLGYPLLLVVLHPLHSLLLVTTIQHLMAVTTAVLVYAVLRRWDLPAWGAVLAACPTLFDSRQIVVESAILPDALYALLIMLAVAALLARRGRGIRRCAFAGLMIGWASITRGNGAPEMVAVLAVLLAQRAGWRALTAAGVGFAVPVLIYMGIFDSQHGNFALSDSDGMFLWSRTMSFADCAIIKPPASLRPLCPAVQPNHPAAPPPAWSVPSLLYFREPAAYLWAPGAWWRRDSPSGFNAHNNSLAMRFALRAIRAQPADYLRTVASGVMLTFLGTDRSLTVRTLHFTRVPDVARLDGSQQRHLYAYGHTRSDTYAVEPYAYFAYLYQEPVYFPGIAFLLVMIAGLVGSARRWREGGGPAALPWAVAVIGIVVPVAVHEYHYRYVITIVPVACLAAGLAFARRRPDPASTPPPAVPWQSAASPGSPPGRRMADPAVSSRPAAREPAAP